MRKINVTLVITLLLLSSIHSQQAKIGGTGGAGGTSGWMAAAPHMTITTAALPDATANSAYSQTLTAVNGKSPLTWTILLGTLPAGLTLHSTTGVIDGTATTPGVNIFTVLVTDSTSPTAQTATQQLSISVVCPALSIISTSPLSTGTVGVAYGFQFQSQGGLGTITWTNGTGIPAGLTLSGTGLLSGTPTVGGTYTFNVIVTDSCPTPQTVTQPFTVQINSPPTITTTSPLPNGTVGSAYSTQMAAQGGTSPYAWAITNGIFPTGMFMNSAGIISGTPTVAVTSTVTIQVTDNVGNTNSGQFTITTSCTPLVITSSTTLPVGAQGDPYSYLMQSSGGRGTLTWSLLPGGSLAPGQTLGVGGLISGAPTAAGTFLPVIQVADSCTPTPQTASNTFTEVIGVALGITTTSPLSNAAEGQPYSAQMAAQGGISPYLWSSGALPAGLGMNSAGVISGTPTSAGTTSITITVTDSTGTSSSGNFLLTVTCPALSMVSTSPLPQGTQGQPYSYTFTASGGLLPLSWSIIAGTLPAGLALASNGVLSGTPTVTGVFNLTAQALDSCSPQHQSVQLPFTLTIAANSGAITITTTTPLPGGIEGVAYSDQLVVQGGTPGYVWSIIAGHLPPGLNLSTGGLISGTPTSPETDTPTFKVVDSIAGSTTKVLSITVTCPALSITSTSPLPGATQGQPYSFQFQSSGGILPVSWSGTGIPAGLTLSPSGLLSGTPTTNGVFTLNISATDSCVPAPQTVGPTGFSLTISVAIPPLTITTSSPLAAATEQSPYSHAVAATGGVPPDIWTLFSGTFPAGLSMDSAGNITGTPTTAQTTAPNIRVTDSVGSTNTKLFSITVSCPTFTVTSTSPLPNATQNQPYSFQFTKAGGIAPITWSGTSIPAGLTLTAGGLLSGTPTGTGTFSPAITATDSCVPTPQAVGPTTFSLTVNPAAVPLQILTPSPLASGTVNVPYSFTMSATGGTLPYSWAVLSGALPTGLSLSSAGIINGTPTVTGIYTVTIRVTDNVAATATKTFSITINPAITADNRYCSANETVVNLPQDGVAAPLQRCVNTALINTPASGPTKTVCASGCDFTTLQAALTASSCGWIINIKSTTSGTPAGTQNVYNGTTTLPNKGCTKANWIWIETDQTAGLPPEGTRITPAWTGKPSLPGRPAYAQPATPGVYVPKLMNNATVLTCAAGANFYRLIGLELTTNATGVAEIFRCVGGDHIIRDRLISHGGNSTNWQDKGNTTRNEDWAQSTYQALIDSYYGDIHISGTGSSNILIGGCASTLEGPDKVVNNFLEAADSSSGLGGCGSGASTVNFQDLEWRRNHIFKPVFWKQNDPTYFGTLFGVKDGIDWKDVVRALVEANLCDQTWGQQSDQPGPCVEFGAKNQSSFNQGTASSSGNTITAITGTFPATMTSPNCANPSHCTIIFNGVGYQAQTVVNTTHITVSPTPPTTVSASFKAFAPGLNPNATVSDITFRYNYLRHASRCIEIFSALSDGGDLGKFTGRMEVHDNVCDDIDGFHWNLSGGACCAWSIGLYIANAFPSPNYLDQLDIHHNTILPSLSGGGVGDGPSLGFGGQTVTTGAIGHLKIYDNISAAGMGRSTAGVCTTPKTALNDLVCWDAVAGVQLNSYCFDHNVLATTTATSGSVTGTANIPPYPGTIAGPTSSPGCGFTLTGTALPASYNAIQFTSLNGANGGIYSLAAGSPYRNTASDGTDPGVHWATFQSMIAGVQ